jgi:hypothetical protein
MFIQIFYPGSTSKNLSFLTQKMVCLTGKKLNVFLLFREESAGRAQHKAGVQHQFLRGASPDKEAGLCQL